MPLYKVLIPPVTVADSTMPRGTREIYEGTVEMSESQAAPMVALGVIALGVTEHPSPQNVEMGVAAEPPAKFVPLPAAANTAIGSPESAAQGGSDQEGQPPASIDLNMATDEELQALPHIGKSLSARIVKARTAKPFENLEEVEAILELPPAKFAELTALITL
jgi:DNA uptake protein ComE-like DNA-binding protein